LSRGISMLLLNAKNKTMEKKKMKTLKGKAMAILIEGLLTFSARFAVLFNVQNTLQNDGKRVNVLKP